MNLISSVLGSVRNTNVLKKKHLLMEVPHVMGKTKKIPEVLGKKTNIKEAPNELESRMLWKHLMFIATRLILEAGMLQCHRPFLSLVRYVLNHMLSWLLYSS